MSILSSWLMLMIICSIINGKEFPVLLFVANKKFLSRTLLLAVTYILFLVIQMGPSFQYLGGREEINF